MRYFILYHWVGGFSDRHTEVGRYSSFDKLLKRHIELEPNSPLDNYSDVGNDYYEEIEIIEPTEKKRVYTPQPKEKAKKDPNVKFLDETLAYLLKSLELSPEYGIPLSEYKEKTNEKEKQE